MIKNKKAYYEFFIEDEIVAGIQLVGSEIKSIRKGKASLSESFCSFTGNDLYLVNCHIDEYEFANQFNHDPKRPKKLLLTKKELKKLKVKIKEKGLTIIPLNMFVNKQGLCKVTICIAKGKKLYDKKNSIFDREEKIRIKRDFNINI
jgi:SsrA-binding protein